MDKATKTIRRICQVVDNNDPDQLGRVRIRIYPEFDTLEESSLPWAEPSNYDDICMPDESGVGKFRIPEVNSFIVVEIDSTWQEFHYTGLTPNRKRTDVISNITDELSNYVDDVNISYPQPLYLLRTKDGTIAYHNTDTGELGIVSGISGVFFRFDSEGNFHVGSKNGSTFTINSDGSYNFSGKTNGDSSFVLYEPLKEILEKLLDHIHVAPNGPTTAAQDSSGTPLSSLKGNLSDMETK